MEFAPNVGILVLGVLTAQGVRGQEIIMRPVTSSASLEGNKVIHRRHVLPFEPVSESVRLCTGRNCTTHSDSYDHEFGKWTLFIIYCLTKFKSKLNAKLYASNYSELDKK
jgi:hypothetical protein